jgi:Ca2+-transporting ATPase
MTPNIASDTAPPAPSAWHALSPSQTASLLRTSVDTGLTRQEAARRLRDVGANRVGDVPERPLWRLAVDQFRSIVVLLLLGASVLAAVLGDMLEALAILVALVLNAAIGFSTEWRARVSLARLRDLTVPHALVRRDGAVTRIRSAELVPGDVIVLEAGAHVPADARLVEAVALRADESALTGESVSVDKAAQATVAPQAPIAERPTTVYLGTSIVAGRGLAVVTATGVASELGRIGQLVGLAGDRTTPLERQVEVLGRRLIGVALAISAFVGLVGIIRGLAPGLMVETAISLAIAAIPEGLPAITAVALAAGLWRLARAGALVRRLPAVETLGSTTIVCADKTGTMTENRMTVVRVHTSARTLSLHEAMSDPARRAEVVQLLTVAVLVNDAVIEREGDEYRLHGDPTETALLQAAVAVGLDPARLRREWRRRHEEPFDATTRFMATWNDMPGGTEALLVKGAPAVALIRDPAEPDIMRRRPHAPGAALVSWRAGGAMMIDGMLLSAGALSAYVLGIWQYGVGAPAGTLAFLTLVLLHPFQALNCRSQTTVWWRLPANRLIWASVATLAIAQWLAIAPTPLAAILQTAPLSAADWGVATACAVWPVAVMQLRKWSGRTHDAMARKP